MSRVISFSASWSFEQDQYILCTDHYSIRGKRRSSCSIQALYAKFECARISSKDTSKLASHWPTSLHCSVGYVYASLCLSRPSVAALFEDAHSVKKAFPYTSCIMAVARRKSSVSSWIIHTVSIQTYLTPSRFANVITSWIVGSNSAHANIHVLGWRFSLVVLPVRARPSNSLKLRSKWQDPREGFVPISPPIPLESRRVLWGFWRTNVGSHMQHGHSRNHSTTC